MYILANQYSAARIYGLQEWYFPPMLPILIVVLGLKANRRPLVRIVSDVIDEYVTISLIVFQLLFAAECAIMIRTRYWVR